MKEETKAERRFRNMLEERWVANGRGGSTRSPQVRQFRRQTRKRLQ